MPDELAHPTTPGAAVIAISVDGRLVPPDEALVSALDHGMTVGDGVFETAKVLAGVPFAITRHLDRLARSAEAIGLPAPDLGQVRTAVDDVLHGVDGDARLRITLTGGVAPLGSDRGDASPTLVVAAAPLAPRAESAAVAVVPWTRNERGALAGVKSTSYAENVVALAYAKARGASEAIFANTVGQLCEGTGSNIAIAIDGRLVTPPLSSGCLAGVTRALVLEWCDVVEEDLPMEALAVADEVFLMSTTRDIQPVHAVDDRHLPVDGRLTTAAARVFAAHAAGDLDP